MEVSDELAIESATLCRRLAGVRASALNCACQNGVTHLAQPSLKLATKTFCNNAGTLKRALQCMQGPGDTFIAEFSLKHTQAEARSLNCGLYCFQRQEPSIRQFSRPQANRLCGDSAELNVLLMATVPRPDAQKKNSWQT
jgi:hypothetical protein